MSSAGAEYHYYPKPEPCQHCYCQSTDAGQSAGPIMRWCCRCGSAQPTESMTQAWHWDTRLQKYVDER